MSEVTYQVDAGTLPQGSCPSTYQELADLLAPIYSVTINTNNTGIYVSATKPADTTLVWKQLDSSGNPVRDYVFVGGLWLSRHTLESGVIVEWDEALPNFATFDGGDANPLSAISGPMWEEVTELRARFPIGAGTLPSGTALAVGDTGGEEKHILTIPELPAHTHDGPANEADSTSGGDYHAAWTENDGTTPVLPPRATGSTGGGLGHNTMPPYYTVYSLRRTARQFYAVP
jgi:hypothetical protein